MSTIVKMPNPNFAFNPPPLGKPNPNEPKPAGKDTRSRVAMISINNASACWQNAFDRIREHFDAPNTQNTPEHQIEIYLKNRVDALIECERIPIPDFVDIIGLLNREKTAFLQSGTKETLKNPDYLKRLEAFDDNNPNPQAKKITSVLPHFLSQQVHNNLCDYFIYLSMLNPKNINKQLIDNLGKDPYDYVRNFKQTDPNTYGNWFADSIPTNNAITPALMHGYARIATAEKFGFAVSSWQPFEPIRMLIQELHKHGPLVVGGFFGLAYYNELPKYFKTIVYNDAEGKQQERDAYGWFNAPESGTQLGHVINIVGAEQCTKIAKDGKVLNQELVYFIDPNQNSYPDDLSRPRQNLDKQCILVMSYERLTNPQKIADIYGMQRRGKYSPFGFAYYNPKLIVSSDQVTTSLSNLSIDSVYKSPIAGKTSNDCKQQ